MPSTNRLYRVIVLLIVVTSFSLLLFYQSDYGFHVQLSHDLTNTTAIHHISAKKYQHRSTPLTEPHDSATSQKSHQLTPSQRKGQKSDAQTLRQPHVTGLIVNSSACHLPDFSPWDSTIQDVLQKEKPLKACRQDYPVILSQHGLQLFMEVDRHRGRLTSGCEPECCFRSVTRAKEGHSDDAFQVGNETTCFEGRTTLNVSHEFVQVTCFCNGTRNVSLYEDFRAFILPSETKRSIAPSKNNVSSQDNLNIYMLGLDSVSTLNFKRYMPKLQKLLEVDLQAIPLRGLTKVGVNTFPNLAALLTGLTVSQMNQSLRGTPFDRQPLVWKQFSSLGYVTMYAEDQTMATFNFRKKGFFKTPTDHYARPLYLAIDHSKFVARGSGSCLNGRLHLELQLQWLKDLIAQPSSSPQFTLVFNNNPSHKGPLTHIKPLEPLLLQFLETYRSSQRYNSSILILFSDHGMRFGPIMRTELGGYESRMPFFYVVLPPWYERRHPQRVANLRVNSRRLTTFFDVHATLRDLLVDAGATKAGLPRFPNQGVSLFRLVPQNRSCADAGIAPHWCVCRARQPLPLNTEVIARAANATVRHINEVLLRHVRPECAELRLERVATAFLTSSETGGKVSDTSYSLEAFDEMSIRLVTRPGEAEFEATVRCYEGVPPSAKTGSAAEKSLLLTHGANQLDSRCQTGHRLVVLDVSRLNLYRGQSDCLTDYFDERRFCYCKNLL